MDATITVHRRSIGTPIEFRTNVLFASSFEKALQDGNGSELEQMIDKIKKLHDYVPETEDSFVSEPHVFNTIRADGHRWYCVARTCVTAQEFESLKRNRLEIMWVPEPYQTLTDWTLDIKEASRDIKLFV